MHWPLFQTIQPRPWDGFPVSISDTVAPGGLPFLVSPCDTNNDRLEADWVALLTGVSSPWGNPERIQSVGLDPRPTV